MCMKMHGVERSCECKILIFNIDFIYSFVIFDRITIKMILN